MKRLLIGVIVPFAATMCLWVGIAGGTAGAHTAKHQSRPAVAHVVGSQTATATSHQSATRQKAGTTQRASEGDGNGNENENGDGENGNDGPGGHQDPPGNVNHECTGDCQE